MIRAVALASVKWQDDVFGWIAAVAPVLRVFDRRLLARHFVANELDVSEEIFSGD
jgi:hypothetical protein